jgi:ArsR family transcriptional regulator
MKEEDFKAVSLLKALGTPPRYEIVKLLEDGDKTVSEIATTLNRPLHNISQHLRILRAHNVVRYHTEGKNVFYRLKSRHILKLIQVAKTVANR